MNITQINETLTYYNNLFDETFQLNEMAIYYGTNHGQVKDILEGIEKLNKLKNGYVTCSCYLIIRQPVTQEEVDKGIYQSIQKDIVVDKKVPLVLVWGEPDKIKHHKKLEGHGLSHILQGHKKFFKQVMLKLTDCMVKGLPAKLDRNCNYTIRVQDYRFCFALEYENNLIKHAVLISAFKAI